MYANYLIYDWVIIFKIYLIWASIVSGLQAAKCRSRAFGKGESTVKTAGWDCPDIQTQCPPYVVDGVSKGTAGSASWLHRVTRNSAKSTQWQEEFKNTIPEANPPLRVFK